MSECAVYRIRLPSGGVRHLVAPDDWAEERPYMERVEAVDCETRIDARSGRPVGETTIEPPPTPGILKRVASYAKAELSLLVHGPVTDKEFERRKRACESCRGLIRHPDDPIGFCGLCGCGTRKRAALSVKLAMPRAGCPLQRW
jgi:hypothetical protein